MIPLVFDILQKLKHDPLPFPTHSIFFAGLFRKSKRLLFFHPLRKISHRHSRNIGKC
jgi:uncharacterized membrane protein YhfC